MSELAAPDEFPTAPPRSPAREAALRVTALSVSLGLTLLLLEGGVRLLSPVELHPTDTFLTQREARLENDGGPGGKTGSMALIPLAAARYRTPEFDTSVRINSRGLREREIPYEKRPGVFRILVLGDSQTFGVGVEAEETYPRVAEERLRGLTGREVEVINTGVPGTGTAHQLDFLEREGWKYGPDAVVTGFFYNDVGNNGTCRLYDVEDGRLVRRAAPEGEARPFNEMWARGQGGGVMVYQAPEPVAAPRPSFLIRHSHLARFLRERLSRVVQARKAEEGSSLSARNEALTAALLRELDRQCRERKARFLVALLPSKEECAASRIPGLAQQNAAFLPSGEGGYPILDLLPPFREAGHEPLFFRQDLHFTAAGHRLAGEELAKKVLAVCPKLRKK